MQRQYRMTPSPPPLAVSPEGKKRWKTGRYYSNSGLMNVTTRPASRGSMRETWAGKGFHPNVELQEDGGGSGKYGVKSMITDSSVRYDPVFHTVKPTPLPTTRRRLKGFADHLDRVRLTPLIPEYFLALNSNPKVFHRHAVTKEMVLDTFDTSVYLSLSTMSVLASGFVLFTYASSKELRKHPSSLLAWLATFDIMMNYHTIPWAMDTSAYIRFFQMDTVLMIFTGEDSGRNSIQEMLCYINQIILSTALVASICYNIMICLDLILTLWNPFSPGYKRAKYYHGLALLVIAYCSVYLNYINGFAYSCTVKPTQRMEISNSGTVGLLLSFYLFISLFSIVYTIYRFHTGLGLKTPIRVRYLMRHVAYVCAYCFCWIWPALSGLFHMIGVKNFFVTEVAVVTTSLSGCLLSIIRSSEPLVWSQIRCFCRKKPNYGKLNVNTYEDMYNQPFAECLKSEMSREVLTGILVCVKDRLCREREYGDLDYSSSLKLSLTNTVQLRGSAFQEESDFAHVEITEYAPNVFCDIRERCGYTVYQLSEALDLSLNAASIESAKESSGKSGSFMFVSHDRTLLIKTIPARERRCLEKKLLKPYHERITEEPDSLLCRFLGLFTMRISGIASVDILVMEGVLKSVGNKTHIYDLKGSQRFAKGDHYRESVILLDQDIREQPESIRVSKEHKEQLMKLLEGDAMLLSELRIMDYSLLLCVDETRSVEKTRIMYPSSNGKRVYHMGVIDLLTVYNSWKVIENKYKTLVLAHDPSAISAIRPDQYATRFLNFIKLVVLDDTENSHSGLSSKDSRSTDIEMKRNLEDDSRKSKE